MPIENLGAWLLVALGLVIGIGAFNVKKGKVAGMPKMLVLGLAGVSLVAGLAMAGIIPDFGLGLAPGTAVVQQPSSGVTGASTLGCTKEDTTVTLSAVDKYTGASVGGTHAYSVGTGTLKELADLGTFTADPGNQITVLYGNGSDSSYFSGTLTFTVPCAGAFDPSQDSNYVDSTKLVQNGSLTLSVYSEDNFKIDGETYNETIGAGESSTMKVDVRATSQKGFPHGGIFVIEQNATDFDVSKTVLTFDGITLNRLSNVPGVLTVASTDNKFVVYETTQAIEGSGLTAGTIYLETKTASQNPGDANDPVISFRPYDYYRDPQTVSEISGPAVSDSTDTATFGHVTSFTIHLN